MIYSKIEKYFLDASNPVKVILLIIPVFLIYYITAKLNIGFGATNYYSWPLWVPVGTFLAALLTSRYNLLPSIFIGHFLSMCFFLITNNTYSIFNNIMVSFSLAFVETMELLVGYKIFKKVISNNNIYNHARNFTKFLGIVILISILSSAITSLIISLLFNNPWHNLHIISLKRFLGHASAYILITPLLLYWRSTSFVKWSISKTFEFLILLSVLVIISFIIFSGRFSPAIIFFSPYFIGPFLLWSIIRFSNRVLTLFLGVISIIAIVFTVKGTGPFYGESFQITQVLLQGFLLVLYLSTLLLYAAISELREAKKDLKIYQEELEDLVEERSEEIRYKNKILLNEVEERKKSEKKLRELSVAVEQSPASVIITDKEGNIEYVNSKFIEMKGYTTEEIVGQNPRMFQSGKHDEKFYKAMWQSIRMGKTWKGEICNKKKNGELFWELAYISPLLNDKGETIQFLGMYEDISRQKEAEEKIQNYIKKLSKSEERLIELNLNKDRFFTIIAHDLKSPFTSLLGFSEFLVNDFEELTLKEIKDYSTNIYESTINTYKLLENLLDWANLQRDKIELKFKDLKLSELINNVFQLYAEEAEKKKIELLNSVTSNCIVKADQNTLSTVLRNLISNAIKFSNSGERVIVDCNSLDQFINISVSDSGVGMLQEDIDKLFRIDIHHSNIGTANEKGTGLGLILCKELVKKNKGEISVKSTLGKGTTFTIHIPTNI